MEVAGTATPRTTAVLRERDFNWFVASRFFAGAAMTLLRATFAWQIFALTGSAFHLGLIGLVQFVPTLAFSLIAGAAADSFDRRRIVLVCLAASLGASALLYWLTLEGHTNLILLYGVLFLVAATLAFEGPARAALLPALVPRALFPGAVVVHSTVQNAAWVAGPLIMGFVIAHGGVASAYLTHVFLVAAALILLVPVRPRASDGERRAVSAQSIREGLAFVRRRQAVLGAMMLDMFAVIFAGATALLPVYANDILQVGPTGYGFLSSALEAGTVLMALVLLVVRPIRRPGRALLLAVAVYGLATILFGLSRSFPLSLAAFVLAGMADQVSMVTRQMIIQLATPDELRGRVSSVNLVFIGASNQLGAVESGFVAALTSPTFSVVSGGVGCLVALAIIAQRMPALRRYHIDADVRLPATKRAEPSDG
jgi:MFS family permease